MKKVLLIVVLLSAFMLSACSLSEEVNHSLEYAKEVKKQLDMLNSFAEEAPQMFKDAALSPESMKELETQLNDLKTNISDFNKTEVPAIAESIHEQLVTKNQTLLDEINALVDNGNIVLDHIENTQILKTINDVISLLYRIENLGL
ncbi:DUF6376 family protein [Brevibacillus panacihumi]|uniref:DUF6376 family protein n=1 Tax=Brevibacillus panacihumi TaxID=497735 RepID=UPI003D19FF04